MGKRICIILPTLKKGGLERVASIVSNEIQKLGHEVNIITLIPSVSIEYKIDDGINVYSPHFKYNKGILFKLRTLLYLIKTLNNVKPYAILSFSEVFNSFCIIACAFVNTKVYISDRSSPQKKLPLWDEIFKKITYPFAHGIIAQTHLAKVKLTKYNKNVEVIPNPLKDIDLTYERNNDLKTVVSVGRLVKSKNFEELINIFYQIDDKDWKLIIVGGGPEYDSLNLLIEKLGMSNQVTLMGQQDDVDFYFSKGSIFAYTSLSEGFPNVLNEAMSYPLPVICYDCIAGPSDMIDNNFNGILIPLNDRLNFKSKLKQLMSDVTLRNELKANSIKNREIYSKEVIAKRIVNFITNTRKSKGEKSKSEK